MPYDHDDPIQNLQQRVGTLEYLIKQLIAAQPESVHQLIKENANIQIDIWKEKSPEIVEIMESALNVLPKK
ncbi:hypothetical protein D9Q01_01505 [Salmonella enterica subsp. enterica serovar Give]|nr:hypothetical protein [Salmonella enterica subsp. enterica serovar Weltevreden]EBZ3187302.1 hypothetical protein [Salmonella enterica subsp. enterica serovar Give]EIS4750873.1 hypothetical protein [Salmonella enterica]